MRVFIVIILLLQAFPISSPFPTGELNTPRRNATPRSSLRFNSSTASVLTCQQRVRPPRRVDPIVCWAILDEIETYPRPHDERVFLEHVAPVLELNGLRERPPFTWALDHTNFGQGTCWINLSPAEPGSIDRFSWWAVLNSADVILTECAEQESGGAINIGENEKWILTVLGFGNGLGGSHNETLITSNASTATRSED